MPTPTNASAIQRWIRKELDPDYPDPYLRHPWILGQPGELVSEGGFTLVETVRKPRSDRIECFLLNGDVGRQRVNGHQWELRRWIREWEIPSIIVPFSALEAASIDRSTVRPIEVRPDRQVEIRHDVSPYDERDIIWKQDKYDFRWENGRLPGRADLRFVRWERHGKLVTDRHFRGWMMVREEKDGSLYAIEIRHVLGDSVFRAKVNGRYRTFVSSFDYQERRPLYFLAEVPSKAVVNSVEDAILALSPPIVHAAVAQGREVKRQGDMFAIPTGLTTKDIKERTGAPIEKMKGVLGTDHVASESIVGKGRATYARGYLHHRPTMRRSDHQSVKLGKEWHLMVPNAVPRRRRGLQVRV